MKYNSLLILMIIGVCFLGSSLFFHFAIADEPLGSPGEKLDLIQALKYETPAGYDYGLGVYLGTFSLGVNHCGYMTRPTDTNDALVCGRIKADGSYKDGWALNGTGFGVMFMSYPEACGADCYAIPRIQVITPLLENGEPNWTVYELVDSAEMFTFSPDGVSPPDLDEWPELAFKNSLKQVYSADDGSGGLNSFLQVVGNDGSLYVESVLMDSDSVYQPVHEP